MSLGGFVFASAVSATAASTAPTPAELAARIISDAPARQKFTHPVITEETWPKASGQTVYVQRPSNEADDTENPGLGNEKSARTRQRNYHVVVKVGARAMTAKEAIRTMAKSRPSSGNLSMPESGSMSIDFENTDHLACEAQREARRLARRKRFDVTRRLPGLKPGAAHTVNAEAHAKRASAAAVRRALAVAAANGEPLDKSKIAASGSTTPVHGRLSAMDAGPSVDPALGQCNAAPRDARPPCLASKHSSSTGRATQPTVAAALRRRAPKDLVDPAMKGKPCWLNVGQSNRALSHDPLARLYVGEDGGQSLRERDPSHNSQNRDRSGISQEFLPAGGVGLLSRDSSCVDIHGEFDEIRKKGTANLEKLREVYDQRRRAYQKGCEQRGLESSFELFVRQQKSKVQDPGGDLVELGERLKLRSLGQPGGVQTVQPVADAS